MSVWLILAAGFWVVFVLPWSMPVRRGIESVSSVVGFSNSCAIAGVGLTLAALLGARLVAVRTPAAGPLLAEPARVAAGERAMVGLCMAVSAAVVVAWWWWIPSSYFGESAYFLTRLDLMTLGLRPYRDFDYGYGPGLLLVPAALHRLTAGAIAVDTAYVATVATHAALGLAAAGAILRQLAADSRVRIGILLFVTVATLNITLGVIYAPLRFFYAAWAVLTFDRVSRCRGAIAAATTTLLCLGGWLLSPEVGLATLAALVVGSLFRHGVSVESGRTLLAAVAAPAVLVAIHGEELLVLLARFGGGALNFPIFPTPSMLALLGCACACLPAMGSVAFRGAADRSPPTAALATALGMSLPPALGRCDPGHILLNGLPLVVVALAWSWSARRPWLRGAAATAALVMLITHAIGFWNHYRDLVLAESNLKALLTENGELPQRSDDAVIRAISPQAHHWGWAKRSPFHTSYLELSRFESLATPIATDEDLDRFLKMSGRYVPAYHVPPASGMVDETAAERVAREAIACDHIMVPSRFIPPAPLDVDRDAYREGMNRYLGELFFFPVSIDVVNPPWNGVEAVMRRIRTSHDPAGTFRDWTILSRRRSRQPSPGR